MEKSHPTRSNPVLTAVLLGAGALAVALASGPGCTGTPDPLPPLSSGEGGSGGGLPGGRAEAMFRELEPELISNCVACHGPGDTPFLAGNDVYKTITAWPGMITQDPAKSKLLTRPLNVAAHPGVNIDSPTLVDTLKPALEAWLEEESKAIIGPGEELGPSIPPLTPNLGFNTVYLNDFGPEFVGVAISFYADELTPNLLELRELVVHATSDWGVHIVHPLFVVFPKGLEADPDKIDSFSGLDQYTDINEHEPLGPGVLLLTNWLPEAKLGISFEKIEPYNSQGGGGAGGGSSGGGCGDVQSFIDNARDLLANNCGGCHRGGNAAATAAVDMRDLDADPASACAQVKNRVNLGNPPASQLFVTTDPNGGSGHPFKFGGSQANFDNFRQAATVWITAEAAAGGQ
jgi:mono/diheme cytochrome c family protein